MLSSLDQRSARRLLGDAAPFAPSALVMKPEMLQPGLQFGQLVGFVTRLGNRFRIVDHVGLDEVKVLPRKEFARGERYGTLLIVGGVGA